MTATAATSVLNSTWPRLSSCPSAIRVASVATPAIRGTSRTRTNSGLSTRTALALIASERSARRSNGTANASSAPGQQRREAQLGSVARRLAFGARDGRRPPLMQDRHAVGKRRLELPDDSQQRAAQPLNRLLAEALPPTILDQARQRSPRELGAAPARSRTDHEVGCKDRGPIRRPTGLDDEVSPALHSRQVRAGSGQLLKLSHRSFPRAAGSACSCTTSPSTRARERRRLRPSRRGRSSDVASGARTRCRARS